MTLPECLENIGGRVCCWPREQKLPAFGDLMRVAAPLAYVQFGDIHPIGIDPEHLTLVKEHRCA